MSASDARDRPLRLYALFHLNLMFSSIEEWRRREVIERCYWPLAELADETGLPLAIEAPGLTLELIETLDPALLERLRKLTEKGPCEFVESGYAQIIGPLVPASVNRANLALGRSVTRRALGQSPRLAFVNEQAWSPGLVPLYREAGFEAVVMEWNNAARVHPEWPRAWRFHPQRVEGSNGQTLGLLWNDSIAFQKLQRVAHGTLGTKDYLEWLHGLAAGRGGVLAVYGNDAEVFDFRPGRFTAEPDLRHGEWRRIRALFERLRDDPAVEWVAPSEALAEASAPDGGHRLLLESADQPSPVKKQPKYNLSRWAVTGRDDLALNTACWRIARALRASPREDPEAWRELCSLWSSDFRTHVTEARWRGCLARLRSLEQRLGIAPVATPPLRPAANSCGDGRWRVGSRTLEFESDRLRLRLNRQRGLCLDALAFKEVSERPLVGTIPHGSFDDIRWSADFYTGHLVFQPPGAAQVTDLSPAEPRFGHDGGRRLVVTTTVPTALGAVDKRWTVDLDRARVELELRLLWPRPCLGSLRLGHVTLLPGAFDAARLLYRTHQGGVEATVFPLGERPVEQGSPISGLISASDVLGLTEGWLELGDPDKRVRLTVDMERAACAGLVTYRPLGGGFFLRGSLSAREVDDTSRPVSNEGLGFRMAFSVEVDTLPEA